MDAGLAARLRPYVPRVLLRQLATDPDARVTVLDATVVFVDLTGFTTLSERLARLGREGAELLVETIDATFADLLAGAYAHGGTLLKFGGDALLLLFEGEGHAARGCRSAADMRARLAELGTVERGGTRIRLRMSAGVHTGRFHLFLVGGAYRELLTTGPGWTTVVRMERLAEAGEVLLSPAAAAALPARHVGAAKGPGRLLAGAPPAPRPGPGHQGWRLEPRTLAATLPAAVAAYAADGRQAPEHRVVTIGFVSFSGTDDLIASAGTGEAADELGALVRDVAAAADEHRVALLGTDVDAGGGKFMLAAGAPVATDEPEERMLLALRRIADRGGRLTIRAGAERGPAFAGAVGPPVRRTYTTMGVTTNLAARLAALAEPGAVYTTAEVLERSPTAFATTPLAPVAVKGLAQPVQAWSVGRPLGRGGAPAPGLGPSGPAAPRAAPGSGGSDGDGPARSGRHAAPAPVADPLPLTGRERELALLGAAMADARDGHGRLVELVSEPGLGKTRLLDELQARCHDTRVLRATCEAYSAGLPYAAWRAPLRALAGVPRDSGFAEQVAAVSAAVRRAAPQLEPWISLVGAAMGIDVPGTRETRELTPAERAARLHEAVCALLPALAPGPVLLRFEDAHLMDEPSSALLGALASRLPCMRWLVAVARRDEPQGFAAPDDGRVLRLRLEPLSAAEALSAAQRAAQGTALAPAVVALAAERSEGNPQFLRDLLRAAADGAQELPQSIEAAALARIDRLAADDRALVRRAAVLGNAFDTELLEALIGDDLPRPDEVTWWRLGRYFSDEGAGRRRFRRAVVREVAYATLPFRSRRELHRRAGEALERRLGEQAGQPGEHAAMLSLHFEAAGDHERTWRYARAAAEWARDHGAPAEAAELYRRALAAAPHAAAARPGDVTATRRALDQALLAAQR